VKCKFESTTTGSERHVFVEIFLGRRLGIARARRRRVTLRRRLVDAITRGGRSGTAASGTARGEKLHVVEDDLDLAALLATRLVFPLIELKPAFDHREAALGQIFRNEFALLSPSL